MTSAPRATGRRISWQPTWDQVRLALMVVIAVAVLGTGCAADTSGSAAPAQTAMSTSAPSEAPSPMASEVEQPDDAIAPLELAMSIVAAFVSEGLPAREPRDNTDRNCGSLGCAALVTTDDITVVVFEDAAAQQRYAEGFAGSHSTGPVVLQYAAARTPEGLQPRYEAVADRVVADL